MMEATGFENYECGDSTKTTVAEEYEKSHFHNLIITKIEEGNDLFSTFADPKSLHEHMNTRTSLSSNNYLKDCKCTKKANLNEPESLKMKRQRPVAEVLDESLKYLNQFYSKEITYESHKVSKENWEKLAVFNASFKEKVHKLIKSIQSRPKELVNHLNTIFYSSRSIYTSKEQEIEKQVIIQFRENVLLVSILKFWFKTVSEFLPCFQKEAYLVFTKIIYEQFCEFFAYLVFEFYQDFYILGTEENGEKKERDRQRLRYQTVRFIISSNKEFANCTESNLVGYYKPETQKEINFEVTLISNLKKELINDIKILAFRNLLEGELSSNSFLSEAKKAIVRFTKEESLREKVKNILNIRVSLEQELLNFQRTLIESEKINDFFTMEKDEFLTCIVLCILHHKINVSDLDFHLKKVKLMMGDGLEGILHYYDCPTYYFDLVVAVDFLNQKLGEK